LFVCPYRSWCSPSLLSSGHRGSFPGSKAGNSLPFSSKVKNAWSCNPIPQYVFMAWCLIKYLICFLGVVLGLAQERVYIYLNIYCFRINSVSRQAYISWFYWRFMFTQSEICNKMTTFFLYKIKTTL